MPSYGWFFDEFSEQNYAFTYKWKQPMPAPALAWVQVTKEYYPYFTFAGCNWDLPAGRETDIRVALVVYYGLY
jgi:hypothetical protein